MDRITGLREVAEASFQEALLAANPTEAVLRRFRVRDEVLLIGDVDYFLNKFQRIFVFGAGKGSAGMARALEQVLGIRITDGYVITPYGYGDRLGRIRVVEAGHPIPDEAGIKATSEIMAMARDIDKNDLVICVISGGGSALLINPADDIKLKDLQKATELFLSSGMTIREINTVRKHLSKIKGGRLAELMYPATLISLVLSDVIGDRLDIIASGPTVPDNSTFSQAIYILDKYEIWDKMPDSIKAYLKKGQAGEVEETPEDTNEVFRRVQNIVVGSNRLSLEAAEYKARRMGMNTLILSSSIRGEAREVGKLYAALGEEILKSGSPLKAPACIIAGGEPTVTLRGKGKGGRNQELALAVAMEIQNLPGVVFLSAGTDGTDGPTDAAGAICDSETIVRARHRMIDPGKHLEDNNSYEFFLSMGDLVMTGPTGTNVMDIHLLLVG